MDDSLADTRPTFSRLTEGKATQSWRSAVPIVVVMVAVVALVAYLASALSSSSQRANVAERDTAQYRDQATAISKQLGTMQNELALARNPGRTTVVLQAAEATGKKGKASQQPGAGTWAAATWGELPNGKTWLRMNAYGLQQNQDGRTYHLWFQPASGQPVDGGALDPDQNGSGFAMATDLPGLDQGKAVLLTLDASGAKQPGETVVKADLPQLKPTLPKPGPQQQGAPQEPGQARSGTDTQQMHQSGK